MSFDKNIDRYINVMLVIAYTHNTIQVYFCKTGLLPLMYMATFAHIILCFSFVDFNILKA